MKAKKKEQLKAIELRKHGYSYSEIQKEIAVSHASLSFWLRNVPLEQEHIKALLEKKIIGQQKAASIRHENRVRRETRILQKAKLEVDGISKRELWLLGIMAYWCEGAKQKENLVSQRVMFSNSDPFLIKIYLKWLIEICLIPESDLIYNLCIHESSNSKNALEYWSNVLNIPISRFGNVSFKRHNTRTIRKNIGDSYHGLIRVTVKKSTDLNRKIAGWILGISNNL